MRAHFQEAVSERFGRLSRDSFVYPPVVASVFCALILLWLIPSAHIEAARETGSVWLSGLSLVNFTARAMLGDALLSSMIGGYGGISRFGHIDLLARLVPLTPVSVAANIPLWSLHAEFWGSVLLAVLSSLYPTSCRAIFWAVFVSLFFIMGTSEYSLFLIGFFAYLRRHSLIVERNWIGAAIGISLASAGVWLSFCPTMGIFTTLLSGARRFTLMNTAAPALLQVEVSALLFMAAVCITPSIRNLLEKRILMWLGKISFGLYLTHFPVLFTVSSLLFSALAQRMSYGFAVFCTSAAALPISLAYASVFQRFVDRPSVDASRHLSSLRLHANRGMEDTV